MLGGVYLIPRAQRRQARACLRLTPSIGWVRPSEPIETLVARSVTPNTERQRTVVAWTVGVPEGEAGSVGDGVPGWRGRGRPLAELTVTAEDRATLERWTTRRKTGHGLAVRVEIVLGCSSGCSNSQLAREPRLTYATGRHVARAFRR
jgi:hypothetical protein